MIKINRLEIENVKRVKAVKLKPTENGLTIIGGKNEQGKTSVLDAIAWALGGNKFKPSEPDRRGSTIKPNLKIVMNNGLVVERKGKNSDLKVIDPNGDKSGQALLDSFVEELALNLPKFMEQTSKEKARTLLQIIGVGDKLYELEEKEQELYNKRHTIGQIADQKQKFANEQIFYPGMPDDLVSATDLIKKQEAILAKNGENQTKRMQLDQLERNKAQAEMDFARLNEEINRLQKELTKVKALQSSLDKDIVTAKKTVEELKDESTEEIKNSIEAIEETNRKIRANLDKEKAEEDAKSYKDQYDGLSVEIEKVRKDKMDLLKGANLPLEGLSVEDGELTFSGDKWDNMSGSARLKVATAIVRKLKPECGFVLVDKLEQFDLTSLNDFADWVKNEGLQIIGTRVSTSDECSIIIEDGYAVEEMAEPEPQKTWKDGSF